MSNKKRDLLKRCDQLHARMRAKYKGRKYITSEEVKADLAELGRFIEYAIEQIREHGSNSWREKEEMANSIRDSLVDTYCAIKSSSISTTDIIAKIQRKIDELEKDAKDLPIGEFDRRLTEINAELRELEGL